MNPPHIYDRGIWRNISKLQTFSRQTLSRNVRNLSVTWVKTVLSSSRDIRYDSGAQVSESIYRAHALHANSLVSWCGMDFWSCSVRRDFWKLRSLLRRIRLTIKLAPRRISINAFERNRYRCSGCFSLWMIFKCIPGRCVFGAKQLVVLRVHLRTFNAHRFPPANNRPAET